MQKAHSTITMDAPGRCMTRLCRHWSHKFDVRFDEHQAHIPFDPAVCELKVVDTGLYVTLEAPTEDDLLKLQGVVADHLQRMAGVPLTVDWQR